MCTVLRCDNASDFLAMLRPSNPRWLAPSASRCDWIFRGESDSAFDLVPTAWRTATLSHPLRRQIDAELADEPTYRSYFDKTALPRASDGPQLKALIAQVLFEWRVVWEFIEGIDRLGLPVPGGAFSFPLWSDDILQFRWYFERLQPFHPTVALARHHGLPARILDWTANPLTAAFFAAQPSEATKPGEIAVWAYNTKAVSPKGTPRLLTYVVERANVGFLHAQEGLFLHIAGANQHFLSQGCWPGIKDSAAASSLIKLVLPKSKILELRRQLAAEGVRLPKLCPTHDNVVAARIRTGGTPNQLVRLSAACGYLFLASAIARRRIAWPKQNKTPTQAQPSRNSAGIAMLVE